MAGPTSPIPGLPEPKYKYDDTSAGKVMRENSDLRKMMVKAQHFLGMLIEAQVLLGPVPCPGKLSQAEIMALAELTTDVNNLHKGM